MPQSTPGLLSAGSWAESICRLGSPCTLSPGGLWGLFVPVTPQPWAGVHGGAELHIPSSLCSQQLSRLLLAASLAGFAAEVQSQVPRVSTPSESSWVLQGCTSVPFNRQITDLRKLLVIL